MTDRLYRVTVSGAAYYEALDPYARGFAKEHDFPAPLRTIKRGRGSSVVYMLTRSQVDELTYQLDLIAEAIDDGFADEPTRRAVRACREAAKKVRATVP